MNAVTFWSFIIFFCVLSAHEAECAIRWTDDMNGEKYCENTPVNSLVYTLLATGSGSTITYSLGNAENVPFSICDGGGESTNGSICLEESLNREDFSSYRVTVCAKGNLAGDDEDCKKVTVNVLDENDNDPQFVNSPYIVEYTEKNMTGVVILAVAARDADDGLAAFIDFALEGSEEKNFILGSKYIVGGDTAANISLAINLDFEESQIHVVTLIAMDRGGGCGNIMARSSSTTIYVNVDDGPDTPPIFTKSEYFASVKENSDTFSSSEKISARDGDYGLNWNVIYALHDDSGIFSIDPTDGELSINEKVDLESLNNQNGDFTLTVTATEVVPSSHSESPMSSNATIIISVEDENDNEPVFYTSDSYDNATSEYRATVAENSVNSVSSLEIFVKDNDQANNAEFSLSLEGGDAVYFSVIPELVTSQAIVSILITDSSGLDYENKTSMEFKIVATETSDPFRVTKADIFLNIADVNDNFPMFETANVETSIPEHSPLNTSVTLIKGSDRDSGESGDITFNLMPTDSFNIHPNGTVYVVRDLDRERRSEYYLTVTATDGGGLINTTQLKIEIEDINDNAPTFQPNQYTANWIENESPSPVTVYALDVDEKENSNLSLHFIDAAMYDNYSIIESKTDDGVITGKIQPIKPLDTEAMKEDCTNDIVEYVIGIVVYDNGKPRKNATVDLAVYLQDVNDHTPEFDSELYNGSVPEESERDTVIANVSATDKDHCAPNNEIIYSVDPEFADKFSISESEDQSYGILKVKSDSLDRNVQGIYNVIVYAVDGGQPRQSSSSTVRVTITDINNKSPVFNSTLSKLSVTAEESGIIDEEITILVAHDDDLNSDLTYNITSTSCQNENGVDVDESLCRNWFKIETLEQKGHIMIASELDREIAEKVTLVVKVQDNNAVVEGNQEDTWTIEITILDFNDNPPIFSETPTFTVMEEVANETIIGQISATDKDKGQEIKFTTDNDYIDITEDGSLHVSGRIDREGLPGINFTAVIVATDNGEPSLSSNITVHFNVMDTNDNTPEFSNETSYNCSVKEELKPPQKVCTFLATDDDIGKNAELIYSIEPGDKFAVDSSTGEISTRSQFDREEASTFELKLKATDNAGDQSRVAEVEVVITILDVDDHDPTYLGFDVQDMEIVEENEPDQSIGFVNIASDADSEEFQENYYFLVYQDESNARDHFILDMTSRELFAETKLDREEEGFYTLYVLTTTSDSISNDSYSSYDTNSILTLNVTVLDINDNSPIFSANSYTGDLQFNKQPSENDVILAVRATDTDKGMNSELSYSITKQTEEGMFSIDITSGNIYLVSAISQGVGYAYILTLLVTDRGGLEDSVIATIRLFDIDETVVLESRYSVDYLNDNKEMLEEDLEKALDADVIIDSILVHDGAVEPVVRQARAETDDNAILSDIYFHATEWNESALIPAEKVIIELDNSQNTQLLIDYGIVTINNAENTDPEITNETDLLMAILVIVCCICAVILIVYTVAFIWMRRRYKLKIKAEKAQMNALRDMLPAHDGGEAENIPNTNMNRTGENPLMLENQKGNIDLDQWLRSQETDDDDSIDDNAVDSQDSAISADPRDTTDYSRTNEFDDLDDADIDFDDARAANLAAALNARKHGGEEDIVLMFDNPAMDHTAM